MSQVRQQIINALNGRMDANLNLDKIINNTTLGNTFGTKSTAATFQAQYP